jgi:sugar phosphate isomerase/epimerase
MRYGVMNFPIKPVVEEIKAAAALGMDYVELAMDPPCAHFSQLLESKASIMTALSDHGLGLVCHMPTFVYAAHFTDSIRQASIGEIIASLEAAVELGAEKVVLHPGYIDGLAVWVLEDAVALAMDSLARFSDRAAALGLTLCVENLFPRLGPYADPDDFEIILDTFPALKFVLDTGHAHIGDATGHRVMDFANRFGDRLAHVHVSDNWGQADEHLPVGQGSVPFEAVTRTLASIGYDDTITLEIFGVGAEEIKASRYRLEQLMHSKQ